MQYIGTHRRGLGQGPCGFEMGPGHSWGHCPGARELGPTPPNSGCPVDMCQEGEEGSAWPLFMVSSVGQHGCHRACWGRPTCRLCSRPRALVWTAPDQPLLRGNQTPQPGL